jgi:hypothetical protein
MGVKLSVPEIFISAATSRMWMVPMGWVEPNVRWVDGHHDRIMESRQIQQVGEAAGCIAPNGHGWKRPSAWRG